MTFFDDNKSYLLLILSLTFSVLSYAETHNIKELGADTNGKNKCTAIIRQAIENAASEGGGTIYFPAGKYLTGPIHEKSNTTLNIEAGAIIKFSEDFDDYLPYARIRYEGIFMKSFSSLIYAVDVGNVTFQGHGLIDGNGFKWWETAMDISRSVREAGQVINQNKYHQILVKENSEFEGLQYFVNQFFRPPLIQIIESKNINIEGVTIKNSPFWTVNPVEVKILSFMVSQTEVGAWPVLNSTHPKADADKDGIADDWEIKVGLDSSNATDNSINTLHGIYTNIEVYLNELLN